MFNKVELFKMPEHKQVTDIFGFWQAGERKSDGVRMERFWLDDEGIETTFEALATGVAF